MFGLLFSTLITLTFMPTLLSLTLQFRDWLSPSAGGSSADKSFE